MNVRSAFFHSRLRGWNDAELRAGVAKAVAKAVGVTRLAMTAAVEL
jgi:hypothetical protein